MRRVAVRTWRTASTRWRLSVSSRFAGEQAMRSNWPNACVSSPSTNVCVDEHSATSSFVELERVSSATLSFVSFVLRRFSPRAATRRTCCPPVCREGPAQQTQHTGAMCSQSLNADGTSSERMATLKRDEHVDHCPPRQGKARRRRRAARVNRHTSRCDQD